jgi:hypothetical protein
LALYGLGSLGGELPIVIRKQKIETLKTWSFKIHLKIYLYSSQAFLSSSKNEINIVDIAVT